MSSQPSSPSSEMSTSALPPAKKRKRSDAATEELEVDVTAPEPPSKKALRKAKKGKNVPTKSLPKIEAQTQTSSPESENVIMSQPSKRSGYGIWIGNLPWSASKSDLRTFITADTKITDDAITRIHMPAPKESATALRSFAKPQNRGFAYVDFSTQAALDEALALSETLLTGRRVLIKDSKSFEGRPDKPKEEEDTLRKYSGKPPSKRIFVGNLDFDATKEGLKEHFSRCGEILDVHLATFEDSGKCKGYGWVEFETIEAGQSAVRGWVDIEQKREDSGGEDESSQEEDKPRSKGKSKLRKWWVNRFQGRPLRMEFAEAKEVRYKKRFGKSAKTQQDSTTDLTKESKDVKITRAHPSEDQPNGSTLADSPNVVQQHYNKAPSNPRKIDARSIKPGAALAAAPRLQRSIVASKGKKTVLA
ncbi:hypothetical protein G7Y79_00032g066740 [Physcia stellaris]|nr:hypothetical protein G7Y79_00032g066740 [Physcia stellaris]